jgi:hypothetical protein
VLPPLAAAGGVALAPLEPLLPPISPQALVKASTIDVNTVPITLPMDNSW